MTMPLAILAFFAIALGAIGTPAWPWFRAFLEGRAADVRVFSIRRAGLLRADGHFSVSLFCWASARLGALRQQISAAEEPDALEAAAPWLGRCCATGSTSMSFTG